MVRRLPLPSLAASFSEMNSFLVSAVCHLMMLVALGLMVAAGNDRAPDIRLAAGVSEGTDLPAQDDALLQDAVQMESASTTLAENAPAVGPVRLFDDTAMAVSDFGSVAAPTDMAAGTGGAGGTAITDFGDGEGGGGSGLAGKGATNFFGVEGYGKRFVYVVDCSGSMSEGQKFQRAVYELLQSIEQLQKDQQYFVVFYNHRSYPMDSPGLVSATEKQFEKTREWISLARPQGGTVPQPALIAALKMKPDAIFFLSDGLFDPETSRVVRQANRGKSTRVPIHTIAFANRENEAIMRTIARNSGGKYRYVP
jgi:von Willebrand factor type A domain